VWACEGCRGVLLGGARGRPCLPGRGWNGERGLCALLAWARRLRPHTRHRQPAGPPALAKRGRRGSQALKFDPDCRDAREQYDRLKKLHKHKAKARPRPSAAPLPRLSMPGLPNVPPHMRFTRRTCSRLSESVHFAECAPMHRQVIIQGHARRSRGCCLLRTAHSNLAGSAPRAPIRQLLGAEPLCRQRCGARRTCRSERAELAALEQLCAA